MRLQSCYVLQFDCHCCSIEHAILMPFSRHPHACFNLISTPPPGSAPSLPISNTASFSKLTDAVAVAVLSIPSIHLFLQPLIRSSSMSSVYDASNPLVRPHTKRGRHSTASSLHSNAASGQQQQPQYPSLHPTSHHPSHHQAAFVLSGSSDDDDYEGHHSTARAYPRPTVSASASYSLPAPLPTASHAANSSFLSS